MQEKCLVIHGCFVLFCFALNAEYFTNIFIICVPYKGTLVALAEFCSFPAIALLIALLGFPVMPYSLHTALIVVAIHIAVDAIVALKILMPESDGEKVPIR
jgi:hypothetical protein